MSQFPWDSLPTDLQLSILLLLPISSLLPLKSISKSLRSLLRSPALRRRPLRHRQDLLFLLFSSPSSKSLALRPSDRRWLRIPIPHSITHVIASHRSLAVAAGPHNSCHVINLFSGKLTRVPPPLLVGEGSLPYVVAMASGDSNDDYVIVAVSHSADYVVSQVYSSRTGSWMMKGQLPGTFAVLGNSVHLNGLLFVLSRLPDRLLGFDVLSGEWSVVAEELPPAMFCWHVLVCAESLLFVAGVEEDMDVVRIGIWEFVFEKVEWRLVCFMPEEFFRGFSGGGRSGHFQVVDGLGIVCFYNSRSGVVVMYDVVEDLWWCPDECSLIPRKERCWLGIAIELDHEVLM